MSLTDSSQVDMLGSRYESVKCGAERAWGYQVGEPEYRGASLIRQRTPLGPYRRPMPRVLGGSEGGGRFFMGEVPL